MGVNPDASMPEVSEADEELLRSSLDLAAAALDCDERAWIIAIARLVSAPPGAEFDETQIRAILEAVYASGEYPVGPIGYVPRDERIEINPDYRSVTVVQDEDGMPYLESMVGFGIEGFVAEGLTRSGRIGDSDHSPGHVLLADVESVVAEVYLFAAVAAQLVGYAGPCQVIVGIASSVPSEPLRLRRLDPETGLLAPADDSLERFGPIIATFRLASGTSRAEAQRALWPIARAAAAQFGRDEPQLFAHPDRGVPEMVAAPGSHPPPVSVLPRSAPEPRHEDVAQSVPAE